MAESVTVTWGAMKISAVQYSTFDTESFTMTTEVLEGETPEQAFDRAYAYCEQQARKTYQKKIAFFREAFAEATSAARPARTPR